MDHIFARARQSIERTQRYPQYNDEELVPWFDEVAKGYSFAQAADRVGYVWEWVLNTVYCDDDVYGHALDLSIEAGALIRAGKLPIPDRHDKLYGVSNANSAG